MTKAIIFDCFGVLVDESWSAVRDAQFGTSGPDHDWAEARMHDVSKGILTTNELLHEISEKTGTPFEELFKELGKTPPNLALFEYIKTHLRSHYKIGFLSNVGENRLESLFTQEQIDLFDVMLLSCEIGFAKPDIEAFKMVAEELDVLPDECVFVDDVKQYCEGARMAGMHPIQYAGFADFRTELEGVLR